MAKRNRNKSGPLGSMFDPDELRQIMEIEHEGTVQTATVGGPDDVAVPVEVDANNREIRVWVIDAMTGYPMLATLYAPANALWRKPPKGDVVTPLTGANTGGPGAATVLHGDGGHNNDVPASLTDTNTVLSPPTGALRLESRDSDVAITSDAADGKDVAVNGGTAKVGRVGDAANTPFTYTPSSLTFTTVDGTGVAGTLAISVAAGALVVAVVPTPIGGVSITGTIAAGADHFKA